MKPNDKFEGWSDELCILKWQFIINIINQISSAKKTTPPFSTILGILERRAYGAGFL